MSLPTIIAQSEKAAGVIRLRLPEVWTQGRTAYGGFSCAIAHEAARSLAPDLPGLRSMQAAFIGPLAGDLRATAELLRRGRSAAFIQADVFGEGGLGLRALFIFAAARDVPLTFDAPLGPDAAPFAAANNLAMKADAVPFLSNFEFRIGRDSSVRPAPEFLRWVRLAERSGLDPATELLACADALPPAAMAMDAQPRAISSMNWTLNLLSPTPRSADGWWLLQARAEQVQEGGSSQNMGIWNHELRAIATGMQSVALF